MKGLSGGRVLVLDDKVDEAYPIIRAFSKIGVATIYFDGNPADFPKKKHKLRGLRLAILDINLDVSGPEKNVASTLVQTLTRIIEPGNGPYGILLWTRHPELKDLVSQYVFSQPQLPKPVFIEMLKKSDFVSGSSGTTGKRFNVNKLRTALTKVYPKIHP